MNIIKTELYKLKKDKLFIGMIIYIFFAALCCSAMEIDLGNISGKIKIDYVFRILNSPELFSIYSYLISIYSIKIVADFSSGYFKDAISFGLSKKQLWFYKTLTFSFSSSILCLAVVLPLSIGALFVGGGVSSDFSIMQFVSMLFLTFVVCIAMSFFVSAVNFWLSSAKLLIVMILMINLLIQTPIMLGYGSQIIKYTIFGALLNVYIGNLHITDIIRIFIVCLYTIALSFLICKKTFLNKDYDK